jgi:hypothetical protein
MQTMQRSAIAALALVLLTLPARPARADPSTRPARPGADPDFVQRVKWENAITFFGEEDTGRYSIRILDKSVFESGTFTYLALWVYDLGEKKWVKVDDRTQTARIVLPADKPADAPDNQMLAEIPVDQEKIGLYFCKWRVNGIEGSIMTRIGPAHVGKSVDLGKLPSGMIAADVPVDKNHGERMIIPDPRTHTGETGK